MPSFPEFEGYQVLEKLESGAIVDTYKAVQEPLGRTVLIKALSPSILPSSPFAATLEREARLLAELHHPNVPHVHDFVRRGERLWLVLEYVDGWSLSELLQKHGRLPPDAAAAIGFEVAQALVHAHGKGVLHRSIEPKNVLISKTAQVQLTHFASAVDGRLPSAPELLDDSSGFNAPAYMSPEQILGEPPDPRSDLFSLGVVLYEILSGEHPFVAPDDQTRTQRIRHAVPVALGRQPGKVPVSLERIVHRCLEKLPSDRFYSAEELCVQLRSALDGLGVASPREAIGKLLPGSVPAQATIYDLESSSNSYEPLGDRSLAPALAGLFVACTLIVVGGAVIYFQASRTTERGSRSGARLELAPPEAAYLRVVAEPWANVIVDGQLVATTPVGQPIPLSPGVHYIKFEHPQAPTEQRTLRLSAGESVLVDVKMKVPRPTQMELESVLSETAADAGDAGDASNAKPSP